MNMFYCKEVITLKAKNLKKKLKHHINTIITIKLNNGC